MEMTGSNRIAADRQTVWDALNDAEILKACIPGCQDLQKLSDTELTAKVVQKIGPVSATFTGKVTLSDIDAPNGYTISGEGQGGVAGFAKGGAHVRLADDPDSPGHTVLTYDAKAQIGGKLAQLGSRLIDATARTLADQFFAKFAAAVSARAAAANPAGVAEAAAPAASGVASAGAAPAVAAMAPPQAKPAAAAPAPAPAAGGGIPSIVWIAGAAIIAVAAFLLLGR
jgi:hypothetical protein